MKFLTYTILLSLSSVTVSFAADDDGNAEEGKLLSITQQANTPQKAEDKVETEEEKIAKKKAEPLIENELDKLGFGPALFIVNYDQEVLDDASDVSVRGDGSIASSGTDYNATLGFELHYDFSFGRKLSCISGCDIPANWYASSSHRLSPFIGVFDVQNGINGIAAGIVYGYTKGDGKEKNRTTLNFGIGWTIHKDRLVLARGVREGVGPPAGLTVQEYTERKDVEGIALMVSANFGF